MHNAILVAQETAEEVKQNANREADLIRREAERAHSGSSRMPAIAPAVCWPNMKSCSTGPGL